MRLAEGVPPGILTRFLSDRASLSDRLAIIRALPARPFSCPVVPARMNRVEQNRRARPETALFVSAALLVSLGSLLVPSGGLSLWQIVLLAVGVALLGLPPRSP